ncbi:MAG: PEP-CTERM sorting domain-containing protein [Bryobacteraceae bacterium]
MYQNNAANPAVDAITFQVYEEEAYLFNQIVGTSDPATRIAIQDAAWNLTNAAFSLVGNLAAQNWVTAAENPAKNQHVNLTGIFILSDVTGTNGQQEFIFDPPTLSRVPEPASLGLLGGVLGLACLWRRFSRRQIR